MAYNPEGTNRLKPSVRVATTGNIADLATGAPDTVDGIGLAADDRVLVHMQSTGSENGIYRVAVLGTGADGQWVRADDADQDAEVRSGDLVYVREGTQVGLYHLTTADPIVVDTTALTFTSVSEVQGSGTANQVTYWSASNTLTSDANLTYDGTTLAVVPAAGHQIQIGANSYWGDTGIDINSDSNFPVLTIRSSTTTPGAGPEFYLEHTDSGSYVDLRIASNEAVFEMTRQGATPNNGRMRFDIQNAVSWSTNSTVDLNIGLGGSGFGNLVFGSHVGQIGQAFTLGLNHTTVAARPTGFLANYLPTSTTDTAVSYPSSNTITTSGSGTFAAGDIILISAGDQNFNRGFYEVVSHVGNLLTVISTMFGAGRNFSTGTPAFAEQIRKVNISILRVGTDGIWETARGSTVPSLTYTDMASGSGTANQVAYWSAPNTLTSGSGLTYDGSTLTVAGEGVFQSTFGNFEVLDGASNAVFRLVGAGGSAAPLFGAGYRVALGDPDSSGWGFYFAASGGAIGNGLNSAEVYGANTIISGTGGSFNSYAVPNTAPASLPNMAMYITSSVSGAPIVIHHGNGIANDYPAIALLGANSTQWIDIRNKIRNSGTNYSGDVWIDDNLRAPAILNRSGDVTISTITSGNVVLSPAGFVSVTSALTQDGGAVFNEAGAAVDFRVEGDTATHLLFVDASADLVGINESAPNSTLDVNGSFAAAIETVTDDTMDATNHFVLVDTSAAPRTINLPAASTCAGRGYFIRNNSTSGNDVTIDPNGAETINGAATLALSDGQSAHVVCNGTAWFTF